MPRHALGASGPLRGERLARPPKGFDAHADSPVADHLKFKQLYWYVELPADLALSSRLRKAVVDRFKLMADALEWLNGAVLARLTPDDAERPVRPAPMW